MSLRIQPIKRKIINRLSPMNKPRQIIIKPNQSQSPNIPIYFDKSLKSLKVSNNIRDVIWSEEESEIQKNSPEISLQSQEPLDLNKNNHLKKITVTLSSNYNADRLLNNEKYKERVTMQLKSNLLQKIPTEKTLPMIKKAKYSNANKKQSSLNVSNNSTLKKGSVKIDLNSSSNLEKFLYDNKLAYLLKKSSPKIKNNDEKTAFVGYFKTRNNENLLNKYKESCMPDVSSVYMTQNISNSYSNQKPHNTHSNKNTFNYHSNQNFNARAVSNSPKKKSVINFRDTSMISKPIFEFNRVDTLTPNNYGTHNSKIEKPESKKCQKQTNFPERESIGQITAWEDILN